MCSALIRIQHTGEYGTINHNVLLDGVSRETIKPKGSRPLRTNASIGLPSDEDCEASKERENQSSEKASDFDTAPKMQEHGYKKCDCQA